jgi:hypothetical protein
VEPGVVSVDGVEYRLAEDPENPGRPLMVRGEHGVVYRLSGPGGQLALKVPGPGRPMRNPPPELGAIPGLSAARCRPVDVPGLGPGVVMPWVEGPTWAEVVAGRRPLDLEECWRLALSLARTLAELEGRGRSHRRLCGRNLMLPGLAAGGSGWPVELVDPEHLAWAASDGPDEGGPVPGYGSGEPRLAGAILLGELLGWADPGVWEAAWGEHYFAPEEVAGGESERYRLMVGVLRGRWGQEAAGLFERAWQARSEGERPAFGEWVQRLPAELGSGAGSDTADPLMGLLAAARVLEGRGHRAGALVRYRQLAGLLPAESRLGQQVGEAVRRLEGAGAFGIVREPPRPEPGPAPGLMRRFCGRCGAQLKPGARFCSRCGAAVPGRA